MVPPPAPSRTDQETESSLVGETVALKCCMAPGGNTRLLGRMETTAAVGPTPCLAGASPPHPAAKHRKRNTTFAMRFTG
jgi:hypothetical protein